MGSVAHPEMAKCPLPPLWGVISDAVSPLEVLCPSDFSAKYRILHENYCSERPGPWDNSVFPYQPHVMNMVEEAIRTGKEGVVFMKAGQIGGTELMTNGLLWVKTYYPGPQLFMTSTEKIASEFGRERFAKIIPDMKPLARRYIPNKRGDILTKRFIDGNITLVGGQSVFNLQSLPFRVVTIDELDSLVGNLGGQGDPLELAKVRTDSFSGPTLIIAYAHPTTKDRGAAKLFLEQSDQRRGFIKHLCGHEFYPNWEHVTLGKRAKDFAYVCPGCKSPIEHPEWVAMIRKVEFRSVLPPEIAADKSWIGVQAGQFFSPNKTLQGFARRYLSCGESEPKKMVFCNKILGEPYEPKVQKVDLAALRSLIVTRRRQNDPEFYGRGQVPPGVRFLTAGQDSRSTELHFAVWGWGIRKGVDGVRSLCGWLIDWNVIERPYSLSFDEAEFHVFDDLIYQRTFPSSWSDRRYQVMQCGHDIGWAPTQIPIVRYCRNWPGRAVPVKGAALTATSSCRQPYASWGAARRHKAGGAEIVDDDSRHLMLNTFMLKTDLFGYMNPERRVEVADTDEQGQVIGTFKTPRILLPHNIDPADPWLEQSKNEAIATGDADGEMVWIKSGPNHFADCNTYALGCCLNLDPFQRGMTAEEYAGRKKRARRQRGESGDSRGAKGDAAMW